MIVALGQTVRIAPRFFDAANRPAEFEGVLSWHFGPASIATIEPIPGLTEARITGIAAGKGQLRITDGLGKVYAWEDLVVVDPGPEPWSTEAVRAQLVMES